MNKRTCKIVMLVLMKKKTHKDNNVCQGSYYKWVSAMKKVSRATKPITCSELYASFN